MTWFRHDIDEKRIGIYYIITGKVINLFETANKPMLMAA